MLYNKFCVDVSSPNILRYNPPTQFICGKDKVLPGFELKMGVISIWMVMILTFAVVVTAGKVRLINAMTSCCYQHSTFSIWIEPNLCEAITLIYVNTSLLFRHPPPHMLFLFLFYWDSKRHAAVPKSKTKSQEWLCAACHVVTTEVGGRRCFVSEGVQEDIYFVL